MEAASQFNQDILNAIGFQDNKLASAGLTLLEALVIIIVTYVVARVASGLSQRASRNRHWDLQLVLLVGRVFYVVVLAIGLVALLYVVAPQFVAPTLGLVGLLGLAFGFAFQDILRNWLSGFFLLLERPFRIGDEITVGAFEGTVETVELRATVLRTPEGRKIMLPNQVVFTSPLINSTFYPLRQTVTSVRIPADRNPAHILPAARAELSKVDGVVEAPAPTVAFAPRGDGDTALEVRYWIDYLHADADAVEREVNARMVFVVAGTRIGGADIAVTHQASFLRQEPPPATPGTGDEAPKRPRLLQIKRRRTATGSKVAPTPAAKVGPEAKTAASRTRKKSK